MPNGDKMGPNGNGPKTGRGLGLCAGSDSPGWKSTEPRQGNGNRCRRGFGCGFGRGLRSGRGYPQGRFVQFSAEEKRKILEAEKKQIEEELKEL